MGWQMNDPKDKDKKPSDAFLLLKHKSQSLSAQISSPPLAVIPSQPKAPWYWEGEKKATAISWLVQDLFPKNSVGLIVGESQAGKSFLAIDLAVAVATGRPFFGKSVVKGGVLYIPAEGEFTLPPRLKAARQGVPAAEKLIAVYQEPPDLMDEEGVAKVIAEAKSIDEIMRTTTGVGLGVIIIDTLISGFGVNDWNSAGETNKVKPEFLSKSIGHGRI